MGVGPFWSREPCQFRNNWTPPEAVRADKLQTGCTHEVRCWGGEGERPCNAARGVLGPHPRAGEQLFTTLLYLLLRRPRRRRTPTSPASSREAQRLLQTEATASDILDRFTVSRQKRVASSFSVPARFPLPVGSLGPGARHTPPVRLHTPKGKRLPQGVGLAADVERAPLARLALVRRAAPLASP